MKYLAFFTFAAVMVPLMTLAGRAHARIRNWLVTLLVFSTALGEIASVNLHSLEAYRGPDRGFEICLTDLVLAALMGILLSKYPGRVRWLPFNSMVMFAFFGVALISTIASQATVYSLFTLFKLVKFYALYWCVSNSLRVGVDLKAYWRGLVAAGLYVAVLAFHQKYQLGIYRVHGPFDHSNILPAFVNLIMPLALIWPLVDRKMAGWKWAIGLVSVFGMLFAVLATFSRAGAAIGLSVIFVSLAFLNLRASSHRAAWSTLLVLLVLGFGITRVSDSFMERALNAPEQSMQTRRELNISAKMMVSDHSLGVGLNNFSDTLTEIDRYQQYRRLYEADTAPVVHNIYYLVMAETGYAGVALFVWMIVAFVLYAARHAFRGGTVRGPLLGGCVIGFVALHIGGSLEFAFPVTSVLYLFGILSGLCVALVDQMKRERQMRSVGSMIVSRG